MTPHGLVESLFDVKSPSAHWVKSFVDAGVVFYAGDTEAVPTSALAASRVNAPFHCVVVHAVDRQKDEMIIGCDATDDAMWSCFVVARSGGEMTDVLPFFIDPSCGSYCMARGFEQMAEGVGVAVRLLVDFFHVIACSNVRMVDVPAPEALNKKRARTGRPPIKSHKVLHIVAPSTYSKAAPQGGTHASPRVHLRRGHIRKNPSGTTTWVQQCVVGSKHGIVTKDYRVSYAGAAA